MQIIFPSASYLTVQPETGRVNLVSGGGTASATVVLTPTELEATHHLAQAAALAPGVSFKLRPEQGGSVSLERGPDDAALVVIDAQQAAADVCDLDDVQALADGTAPLPV